MVVPDQAVTAVGFGSFAIFSAQVIIALILRDISRSTNSVKEVIARLEGAIEGLIRKDAELEDKIVSLQVKMAERYVTRDELMTMMQGLRGELNSAATRLNRLLEKLEENFETKLDKLDNEKEDKHP